MKQNSTNRRLKLLAMILGIFTSILVGTLPLIRMVVSPDVAIMILTVGGVLFVLTMALMILLLLLSPNLILKFTALPVTYAIVMIGYMLYKLNVYNIFKMMLGAEVENSEQILESTASIGSLSIWLHVGVWICLIPLIIVVIVKAVKMNKRDHQDFSTFDTAKGIVVKVIDTHRRINKIKAYKISLNIQGYQMEEYEVTKEFLVPVHMLHVIAIGNEVDLKINPYNRDDVYIQSEYGIL